MEEDYADFPVFVEKNPVLGRHLVAKRDLKKGEILLRENAIFMSPNAGAAEDNQEESTCLSCCLKMKKKRECGRCGWPLCSEKCENDSIHKENECEIFCKNGIKPEMPSPYCFIAGPEFIKVLRILFISERDEGRWSQIKKLQAHVEERKKIPKILFMSTLTKRFVHKLCNLQHFDNETIDFILGVIDINAFGHTLHPDNPFRLEALHANKDVDRNATFLYPKASMAAHGCKRNVRWETCPSTSTLEMRVAEDILKGSILTHPYVDLMQGTPIRRRQLKEQFYFDCTCSRCCDSTELGTFFSALKCPDCTQGHLLAEEPLNYETHWKCDNEGCDCIKPFEFERKIVQDIRKETKSILEMLEGEEDCERNFEGVERLAKMLGKYRGKKLHINHFAIIDVEYHLVKRMAKMKKPTVEFLQEMRRLIHKFLDVAVVFYPGIK